MIALTVTFQMDEEQLRDIFEYYDVEYTEEKAQELRVDMTDDNGWLQEDLDNFFYGIIEGWVDMRFGQ